MSEEARSKIEVEGVVEAGEEAEAAEAEIEVERVMMAILVREDMRILGQESTKRCRRRGEE